MIGPGAPASTLPGRVIRDLRSRQLIEVGSLDVWRDFVDVRDVAEAVVAVALADAKLPPVLNVGTGRATLARDVAGLLFERSGQPAKIVEDGQDGGPGVSWQQADIGLIGASSDGRRRSRSNSHLPTVGPISRRRLDRWRSACSACPRRIGDRPR